MRCSELIHALTSHLAETGDSDVVIMGSRIGVKFDICNVVPGVITCAQEGFEFLIIADEDVDRHVRQQISEAMDKADRGDAVYFSEEEAETIMESRKAEIISNYEAKD